MLAFSSIFPKRGKGPEKGQGTGPLVTRAGEDKVPVRMVGSRAAGPESSLPFSQRVHKEQGTYLERETPRTPEGVAAEEREKEMAKEQARAKRQQAKRAREEAAQAEASKRQKEDAPEESAPTPVQEISDEGESSPSAQLLRRENRRKARNDVQLPSPTPAVEEVPQTAEVLHRSGKEVADSEAAAPLPEASVAPPPETSTAAPSTDEVLPPIPDFPEEDSYLGMNEDNYVEVNEPLMIEQQLNRMHDPEMATEAEAIWKQGGVNAFAKESLRVCVFFPFSFFSRIYLFSQKLTFSSFLLYNIGTLSGSQLTCTSSLRRW